MSFATLSLLLISAQLVTVNAARILGIFAFPARGSYAFVEPLLIELSRRGHHVTSISNFPQDEPLENFRDIVIKENRHLFDDFGNFSIDNVSASHFDVIGPFYKKAYEMNQNLYENPEVIKLRQYESFDVILLDVILTESFYGFGEEFQAPMVAVSTWGTMISIDELVGNTTPLSYIPNMLMLRKYNENMNFWRRCLNVVLFLCDWMHYYFKYMPMQEKIYSYHFPNASKSLVEAQKNFSLVLVNDHFAISTPRPYVPNMIEVAGMHIPNIVDDLSLEIEELLKDAKNGVIYVIIKSFLPDHIMEMILEVFGDYQQLVIWSNNFQTWTSLQIPSNVCFYSNVSHYALMSHPKVQLIISHGEYLNIIESIYYGIPILSLPRYDGINEDYIDWIRKLGNGISLTWDTLNRKQLSLALNDLLLKDGYRQEAKHKSMLFQDQMNTPLERAIYWIEYVLKFNGASHLRNLGQNLTVWEFYNVDVFLMIALMIILFICFSYIILNLMLKIIVNVK
ncbi:UDP-glucosyltransferase 2-like [Haematobia irritans]|uniref:UDP-glucosyltransferase 2-like n=1 Tax=Haematobia irritans TaxID=7368 RepID=UPI003F4F52FC